jgi:hypothetical protein
MSGGHVIILLFLMGLFNCGSLDAAPQQESVEIEIFSASDSMTVDVNLKALGELSPAMKAILAFYAMRANGGCPPGELDENTKAYKMECPLTTALGLGDQCSDAQITLVKTWFKDGIPALGLLDSKTAQQVNKDKNFASICNSTPYTATHQSIWDSIRVKQMDGGMVTITAEGEWTSGPEGDSGSFHAVTTYRILPDRVQVVSHKEENL